MAIIVTVRRFKTNGDYKTGTNSSIYELKSATVYQNPITNIYNNKTDLSLTGEGTDEKPFTLVNDLETVPPHHYYGTDDEENVRGYFPLDEAITQIFNTNNYYNSLTASIYNIVINMMGGFKASYVVETALTTYTQESTWTLNEAENKIGNFKVIVTIHDTVTDNKWVLQNVLGFDYVGTPVQLDRTILTDSSLTLALSVNGSNYLQATVNNMPNNVKRVHFCFERCTQKVVFNILTAKTGIFTLLGLDVVFNLQRAVLFETGTFTLIGNSIGSPNSLLAETANFLIETFGVGFLTPHGNEYVLNTNKATFTLTMQTWGFKNRLPVQSVVFRLTGANTILTKHNELLALELTWDDIINVPVATTSSVEDWNTFFDLPTYGTSFTSVVVDGNIVKLYGGQGITLKENLFALPPYNTHLLKIEDFANCITHAENGVFSFSDDENGIYSNLNTVKLPALITAGDDCFASCYALNVVDFTSLTTAGNRCFVQCENLINPNFTSLLSVGEYCFYDCVNLIAPTFEALEYARAGAFYGCNEMQTSNFSSLITAGANCFQNCDNLVNPDFSSLIEVGDDCFNACIRLENPNLPLIITVSNSCFVNCVALSSPYLPLIASAGNDSFRGCESLIFESIETLETAGDNCFFGCWQQTSISLPNLTTAGLYCFMNCGWGNPLTINLPSLISIGDYGFYATRSCSNYILPVLENMGSSTAYNYVFGEVPNTSRAITVPIALMTCNGGEPDGDIVWLQNNGPLTITTV